MCRVVVAIISYLKKSIDFLFFKVFFSYFEYRTRRVSMNYAFSGENRSNKEESIFEKTSYTLFFYHVFIQGKCLEN